MIKNYEYPITRLTQNQLTKRGRCKGSSRKSTGIGACQPDRTDCRMKRTHGGNIIDNSENPSRDAPINHTIIPIEPSMPIVQTHNAPNVNPLAIAAKELKFACQLAHGSPVAIIHKWSDISELYQSIADCFSIPKSDIMFLTVNDFRLDMRNLFTGTLNFKDMLYAHVRGQAIELTVLKDSANFGVTITDNGLGNAFIKIISAGSVFDRAAPATRVGQIIEKINGESVLGRRHYQVARILKNIKKGETCTIRLISPLEPSTGVKMPKQKLASSADCLKGTIRFKSDGGFAVEDIQSQIIQAEMCAKLNEVFDNYLGVQDDQLAMRIWETASNCETLFQLSNAIKKSELAMFDFPDGLVFDMWGIIGDLKREQKAATKQKMPMRNAPTRQTAMSLFNEN
ncbi:unnamed protein product [Caenorhabditis bovis]|uniref:PDZ domain-containing protein n=1 Tax=Caenorhabditis bovis TaxID=2654633 RepID=A0A8S1ES36_9PELO|nr:unnamed protein product [Caenorhabditis bovis]